MYKGKIFEDMEYTEFKIHAHSNSIKFLMMFFKVETRNDFVLKLHAMGNVNHNKIPLHAVQFFGSSVKKQLTRHLKSYLLLKIFMVLHLILFFMARY